MMFLLRAKRKGAPNDEGNPYIAFAANQAITWHFVETFPPSPEGKRWIPEAPANYFGLRDLTMKNRRFLRIEITDAKGHSVDGAINWIEREI